MSLIEEYGRGFFDSAKYTGDHDVGESEVLDELDVSVRLVPDMISFFEEKRAFREDREKGLK